MLFKVLLVAFIYFSVDYIDHESCGIHQGKMAWRYVQGVIDFLQSFQGRLRISVCIL